ncbi:hypothetical protein [Helicobacter trogontum]|uniref:hypothetical protein n=1 Tax=Helicobacter trogontum TaxID=50960 RepID=UPI000CF0BA8F|nr:hypothetical protein [Helicobacter trogontum]
MKKLILVVFSINIMFADVLPKVYYDKWILLEKPNENEKCKEIFIDSKNTECLVIHNTEPQAYDGEIEPDYIMLDAQNNTITYRYFMADYLLEDSISVRKHKGSYIFRIQTESTLEEKEVEKWVLEPIGDSVLTYWYKMFDIDNINERHGYEKSFYIKEEKAKELGIPIY